MKSKDHSHIQAKYDEVSKVYDEAHPQFDIPALARAQLFKQLDQFSGELKKPLTILDLASGTGNLLFELGQKYPDAALYGLDLSEKMTAKARELNKNNPRAKLITDNALHIDQHFASEIDLLIVQFLLSYVDTAALLSKINLVLKPGGVLALTTTTLESFPEILNAIKTIHKKVLFKELTQERIETFCYIPKNLKTLCDLLQEHGYEIIQQQQLETKITFESYQDFRYFAVDRGWFLQAFDHINVLADFVLRIVTRPLFPFTTTLNASMVLVRKISR